MHGKLSRNKTDSSHYRHATHHKHHFHVLPNKTQLRINLKLLPGASNDANYYRATKKEVRYAI